MPRKHCQENFIYVKYYLICHAAGYNVSSPSVRHLCITCYLNNQAVEICSHKSPVPYSLEYGTTLQLKYPPVRPFPAQQFLVGAKP